MQWISTDSSHDRMTLKPYTLLPVSVFRVGFAFFGFPRNFWRSKSRVGIDNWALDFGLAKIHLRRYLWILRSRQQDRLSAPTWLSPLCTYDSFLLSNRSCFSAYCLFKHLKHLTSSTPHPLHQMHQGSIHHNRHCTICDPTMHLSSQL